MSFWLACLSALWLGIQTSISPCPLATNIAAIAFLSRDTTAHAKRVLVSGMIYAMGRILAYLGLSVLLLWLLRGQLTTGSALSGFLQKYGLQALGPLLILLGMLLLNLLNLPGSLSISTGLQERAAQGGMWWSGALGFIFAMAFCPASAALFFMLLIPLAAAQGSMLLLPTLYGIGTALPVLLFAFLLAFANQYVGKAFNRLSQVEKWVRVSAGIVFIGAGFFYALNSIYGVKLL